MKYLPIISKKSRVALVENPGDKVIWKVPPILRNLREIIDTLKYYNIESFADRKNIGIWHEQKSGKINKIAAIGIKVKKWIAYHGFALNISNNLDVYKKIIPCGVSDRGVTNLNKIKKQNYKNIENNLIKNFLLNIKS